MNDRIALLLAERHIAELHEDAAAAHRATAARRTRRAGWAAPSPSSLSHRAGVFAMVAGLVLAATATFAVATTGSDTALPTIAVRAADSGAAEVERDMTVTSLSGPPGHTSGSDLPPGDDSVGVPADEVAIYDEVCTLTSSPRDRATSAAASGIEPATTQTMTR